LKRKAATSSVNFLDLMADPRFTPADFSDTVHLRSDGSIKLAKIISAEIQQRRLLP
jgi:lysophospholipase L1-like esterase